MVAANDRIRIRGIGDALDRRRGRVVITEGGCSRAWVLLDGETNPILVDVDRLAVESGDELPEPRPRHRRPSFRQDEVGDRSATCPCGKVFQKRYREQRFCSRRCAAKFTHHHDSTAHIRPTSPWRRAKHPDPPPTECAHHWQIDAFQHGICLRCGAERQFPFTW